MGIVRNLLKVLGGGVFPISLGILIFASSFAEFTSYNNLQPQVANLISTGFGRDFDANQMNLYLKNKCENNQQGNIELPITGIGQKNLTMNCSEILSSKPEDMTKIIGKKVFDDLYFKKYDCNDLIACAQNLPKE